MSSSPLSSYKSWGNAKCTHTKREILRNRLFAVLFNKLSYNYHLIEQRAQQGNDERQEEQVAGEELQKECLFTIQYSGKTCTFPDEFIQVLMDTNHTIEVCPRSTITTFGMGVCVKELDGSWTNIPIGFFFRTGYENEYGQPAFFSASHGGLDLHIANGPLVQDGGGSNSKCDIQFYVAIEGLCGWHSNHNPNVPWIQPISTLSSTSTAQVYTQTQAIQAIRLCSILSITFNSLSTELNLPYGGYGILGVCNDSAAIIDYALNPTRGTNMYPLISTGRFLFHTSRRLQQFKQTLMDQQQQQQHQTLKKHSSIDNYNPIIQDVDKLVYTVCNIDSDIHNSPSHLSSATKRYCINNPISYFQLTEESKEILLSLSQQNIVMSSSGL